MNNVIALTSEERHANLDLDQLRQLVGLVEYDQSKDTFPVTGWDALVFVVGNATQTSHYFQSAFGMELVAYSGPETGNRDHKAFVLESGSCRFVIKGGVAPDSPLLRHHRDHGDGVVDIALEVPDVDRCIEHARATGATVVQEPQDITDEHRPAGRHRHLWRHPAHAGGSFSVRGRLSARLRCADLGLREAGGCAEAALPGT
jgi:4-hydroxyphenylpyruvate dioxygenase